MKSDVGSVTNLSMIQYKTAFKWNLCEIYYPVFFLKNCWCLHLKTWSSFVFTNKSLNFHLNCCLLCVSSTRTSMLNYTESDNILTQTLCQLSGRCKDSSTCHTASSTELRPRLHMTKWLLQSTLARLRFCPVSKPHFIGLTQLPVVLQLHSSAPFLCCLKCPLSSEHFICNSNPTHLASDTIFSLNFPLTGLNVGS